MKPGRGGKAKHGRPMLSALLSATLFLSGPAHFPANAQPAEKVYRIGFISAGVATAFKHRMDAFRDGLRTLGYVDGKNVVIVERYGGGRSDLVPKLAEASFPYASRRPGGGMKRATPCKESRR